MSAIGFVELNSIARGYEAADAALKTSDVQLASCHAGCPGKFYFLFKGDTTAVEAAVIAATAIGRENVVDSTVIANVHEDVIKAMAMATSVTLGAPWASWNSSVLQPQFMLPTLRSKRQMST